MKEMTVEWMKKAAEDLQGAGMLISIDKAPKSVIGFLCQQCVEKSLKDFLEEKGKKFPKTHDIEKLRDLCIELDDEFAKACVGLNTLTQFAVEMRYPEVEAEAASEFTFEEIRAIFHKAEVLYKFVSEKLSR